MTVNIGLGLKVVNRSNLLMLEKLRNKHIDINIIIKEELEQILPQYIEEIIKNVYNNYESTVVK